MTPHKSQKELTEESFKENDNEGQDDDFFGIKDQSIRDGSFVDDMAGQRQRVRLRALPNASHQTTSLGMIRQQTSLLTKQTGKVAGFFENTSYTTPGGLAPLEMEDDDPFYELYDCHKVTFLEKKI